MTEVINKLEVYRVFYLPKDTDINYQIKDNKEEIILKKLNDLLLNLNYHYRLIGVNVNNIYNPKLVGILKDYEKEDFLVKSSELLNVCNIKTIDKNILKNSKSDINNLEVKGGVYQFNKTDYHKYEYNYVMGELKKCFINIFTDNPISLYSPHLSTLVQYNKNVMYKEMFKILSDVINIQPFNLIINDYKY